MLKKIVFIICVFCLAITVSAEDIYALGIGGYLSGRGGISTVKIEDTRSSVDYALGAGFVLDTAVATNDSMNYRLAVGYDNVIKSGIPFFNNWSMHRVSLDNIIGFALFKNSFLRVWMGPQIELACQVLKAEKKQSGFNVGEENTTSYKMRYHSVNYTAFSLGFGAVAGININTGNNFTVSFDIGINTAIGIGPFHERTTEYTHIYMPGFIDMVLPSRLSSRSKDMIFGKAEGIARLSFIYRLDEQFIRETPQNVDVKLQRI